MDYSIKTQEDLVKSINNKLNLLPKLRLALEEGRTSEKNVLLNTWPLFQALAIKAFFIDHDLALAKKYFSKCGFVDELLINRYDEKIPAYGLNHFGYVLLSDNIELINRFADIRDTAFWEMVEEGTSAPFHAIQCLIKEDTAAFEKAMIYVRSRSVPKFGMEPDAAFYEALAERNKSRIETVLTELLSDKMHAIRNKEHTTINSFISHPAIGYAKLAWLKGLEVEIKSHLVPQDLLFIKPLPFYDQLDLFSLIK